MRIHHNKKGFSLLEVIFALAILIVGIVGVLAFFPVGLKASKRSGDFTVAAFLAQQQMDSIKIAGWSVYGTNNGWYNYRGYRVNYSDGESPFPINPNFSWVAHVEDLSPTVANLKQVTLSIYWLDGGSQQSEDFVTYLAKY
jgi:type II secretory pathway pseudopilin PulG